MRDDKNLIYEMEKTFTLIPGILGAKVVFNQDKNEQEDIEEIHILATTERNAKQISRDVQSLMLAKFNINCDHKKISVAQVQDGESLVSNHQIKIKGIHYFVSGNRVSAEVKLEYKEMIYSAMEEGPNTLMGSFRVIANATIDAIHQLMDKEYIFAVEDVEKVYIGKREVIIVAICGTLTDCEEMLIGTAIVKGDVQEAVARATLDALNRKIVKLSK